jgi:biotin carboxylase
VVQRPRVVLVGPFLAFPWVFDAAARAGVDLLVIPREDEAAGAAEAVASLESVVQLLPLSPAEDPQGALAALVALHQREPLQGIMTGSEMAVPFTALAARTLGLVGLSEEAADVVRDKRSMRERLRRAGLGTPAFVPLDRPEDWADALVLGFPVVVKPVDGVSSLGVIRADSEDALREAVHRAWRLSAEHLSSGPQGTGRRAVMVEEYLDGPEVSVESLAFQGEARVAAVNYKGHLPGPYFEELAYRSPAPLPGEVLDAIEREVVAAHAAFGVTDGVTHTELRLVGGVRPVVVEMAARIGGSGVLHHHVQVSTGVDLAAEALRVHIGQQPVSWTRPTSGSGHAASYSLPVGSGGRVVRIRGLEAVRADPRVDHVVEGAQPGTVLLPYPDFTSYPALVMSHHASDAEAVAFHDHLARTLSVEYADAERGDAERADVEFEEQAQP